MAAGNSKRVDAILDQVRGRSILDVGCAGHVPRPKSPSWLHGRLVQLFPLVTGIDISNDNIRKLQVLGYGRLHVANAETFALPQQFDTVVAGELLEHLSNPAQFLERAKEHLSPDGRVVVTTPYPFSLLNFLYAFAKFPRTVQNLEHTLWVCPQTMHELARRAGLRIVLWDLVEDYDSESPSVLYRMFAGLIGLLGPLIPKRLRGNTLLVVLEAEGRRIVETSVNGASSIGPFVKRE